MNSVRGRASLVVGAQDMPPVAGELDRWSPGRGAVRGYGTSAPFLWVGRRHGLFRWRGVAGADRRL